MPGVAESGQEEQGCVQGSMLPLSLYQKVVPFNGNNSLLICCVCVLLMLPHAVPGSSTPGAAESVQQEQGCVEGSTLPLSLYQSIVPFYGDILANLLRMCCLVNPAERPSFEQVQEC